MSLFRYSDLPLSGKLLLPLLSTTAGIWVIGAFYFGYVQTARLEQNLENKVVEFAVQLEQNFAQRVKILDLKARSITEAAAIGEAVAQNDQSRLLQILLPLQTSLNLDLLKVVNLEKVALVDLRGGALAELALQDAELDAAAINGLTFTTVLHQPGEEAAALVKLISAKTPDGITGGVLFGQALDQELLSELQADSATQLILVQSSDVIATTLPNLSWDEWQPLSQQTGVFRVRIRAEDYLAVEASVADLIESEVSFIILHPIREVALAQRQSWLLAGCFGLLGIGVTSGIGIWVTRLATRRLTILTQATERLAKGDFGITVDFDGRDEVSRLATGFNFMVKQVDEREQKIRTQLVQLQETLQALEITKDQLVTQEKDYSRTLEVKVEERTQALTNTLNQLQETQSQLIQAEKMASLGQMVAGIAHEINNPINFIHGNIDPLTEYVQDLMELVETYQAEYPQPSGAVVKVQAAIELEFITTDIARLLSSMKTGTQRVKDIVVSLRNYSRLDEAVIKAVDVHEGIDSTLLILNHRLTQGIEVRKDYGALSKIFCSPAQLNQVYTNIIANAIDAMFETDANPKQLEIRTRLLPLDRVQISIKDNGGGIPEEIRHKIFDPFFTTKGIGKGTGLGLGICYRIIQQHQGQLEVFSEVGKGTEFLITLPINVQMKRAL